jgi:sec-independent protein translocase protein TatC
LARLPRLPRVTDYNSSGHNPEEFRLSLIQHLEELRTRVFRSFAALVVFWIIGWYLERPVREFLTNRAVNALQISLPKSVVYNEAITDAPQLFTIKLKMSFCIALIAAFPLIVLQIWGFIAPGLKPSEQKPFKKLAPMSVILFVVGAGFCWFTLPSAYTWFGSFADSFPKILINQEVGTMAMFSLKLVLAFGIGFQLPLVVYVLGALNLLSAETLMKYWRHCAVAIFFLAGAITPSNDPATMLAMAIPMSLLFMISAYAVKFTQRNRKVDDYVWAPEPETVVASNAINSPIFEPHTTANVESGSEE